MMHRRACSPPPTRSPSAATRCGRPPRRCSRPASNGPDAERAQPRLGRVVLIEVDEAMWQPAACGELAQDAYVGRTARAAVTKHVADVAHPASSWQRVVATSLAT